MTVRVTNAPRALIDGMLESSPNFPGLLFPNVMPVICSPFQNMLTFDFPLGIFDIVGVCSNTVYQC